MFTGIVAPSSCSRKKVDTSSLVLRLQLGQKEGLELLTTTMATEILHNNLFKSLFFLRTAPSNQPLSTVSTLGTVHLRISCQLTASAFPAACGRFITYPQPTSQPHNHIGNEDEEVLGEIWCQGYPDKWWIYRISNSSLIYPFYSGGYWKSQSSAPIISVIILTSKKKSWKTNCRGSMSFIQTSRTKVATHCRSKTSSSTNCLCIRKKKDLWLRGLSHEFPADIKGRNKIELYLWSDSWKTSDGV